MKMRGKVKNHFPDLRCEFTRHRGEHNPHQEAKAII